MLSSHEPSALRVVVHRAESRCVIRLSGTAASPHLLNLNGGEVTADIRIDIVWKRLGLQLIVKTRDPNCCRYRSGNIELVDRHVYLGIWSNGSQDLGAHPRFLTANERGNTASYLRSVVLVKVANFLVPQQHVGSNV